MTGRMSSEEAELITGRVIEHFSEISDLLADLHDRQAHRSLGYISFEAYKQERLLKIIREL